MTGSDIARYRQNLAAGVGTSTRRNRVLPAARLPTAIPVRIGKAGPTEEAGDYNEVDYALRVLDTQNAPTYQFDMLNTPLDGSMRLYLQTRPIDTTAGDDSYYASSVKLTTTDGLLQTDYQLKLKEAIIRPSSGTDKVAGFIEAPVTNWYTDNDLVRGPTGVHALVKKAKTVDMVVDGVAEKLTLKPPPYTAPAGNGLCVLDEILKLGDPWHGLIQGGTVRLPNGATRPATRPGIGNGSVYALIPHGVTPAATADAADVAAGRTWLNYGLLAGSCLYEQNISANRQSWVYIAPDNSLWRVSYEDVNLTGYWHLRLRFYPLRRAFLTTDKWGGLVQTIDVAVTPAAWWDTAGTLQDIDSKGANAVFFKTQSPAVYVTAAALLTIQGVPGAATSTYTLLIDPNNGSAVYSPIIDDDYSEVDSWITVWEMINATQGSTEVIYITQDLAAGDPIPPGVNEGSNYHRLFFSSEAIGIFYPYTLIFGYAFDSSDNLQAILYGPVNVENVKTERYGQWIIGGTEIGLNQISIIQLGPESSGTRFNNGSVRQDCDSWSISRGGIRGLETTYADNKYGAFNGSQVGCHRYSNRLSGLKVSRTNAPDVYWLPPISPDSASVYVQDVVNNGSTPFATYHPITHQIVWETGFVNFV